MPPVHPVGLTVRESKVMPEEIALSFLLSMPETIDLSVCPVIN